MKYTVYSDSLETLLDINLIDRESTKEYIKYRVEKDGFFDHGMYCYFLTDDGYGVQAI